MTPTAKLAAGSVFPSLSVAQVGGGAIDPGSIAGWRMLVVYRGKHCPLCKKYLKTLNELLDEFKATGTTIVAVSADPKEKAEADVASEGWHFPVGYDLTLAQMRSLGLYVSEPRSPQEIDRAFSEPALFVINPDDKIQIIDLSNAPFSRPDLSSLLAGIRLIKERAYPIRGMLA